MGFFKDLVGIAAPIAGGILGGPVGSAIGGALGGAISGSGAPKSTTTTQGGTQNGTQDSSATNTSSTTLDPRIAQLLGLGGSGGGLLGSLSGMLNGGSNLSGIGNSFLNAEGAQILNNGKAGTDVLMSSQYSAPTMEAAQVRAPAQNTVDLSSAFNRLLGGGDTSTLMNSLSAGNALAGAQFNQNQQSLTDNLQRNVLPSIRSGAIAAGQYGGSRQGIAEGLAISDLTKQLSNSNTQFGLGTTAANSSALAGAYENGQNRALSAAQGLSAQQYAAAMQDAQLRQGADQTNIQALMNTRGQNSSNLASGIGLQQGLLGSAANYGNADLSRLGQTAGILAPFLSAGATATNTSKSNSTTNNTTTGNVTQPLYNSPVGNAVGGALLGGQLSGLLGGSSYTPSGNVSGTALPPSAGNYNFTPTNLPVSSSLSSIFNFG